MTKVQSAWEDMRICYQNRYARMCEIVKENEFHTPNLATILEMRYVLHEVFGLTDEQVDEVERNGGLTNADIENE